MNFKEICRNWDNEGIIDFLKNQKLFLDYDDINILKKKLKVTAFKESFKGSSVFL